MIRTKNIYFAAFLFTENISYSGTEIIFDVNNKSGVIFSFKGQSDDSEDQLKSSYEDSLASVNIRDYIDNLVLVRDLMYKTIEKNKTSN